MNDERIRFTFPVLKYDEEIGEVVPTEDTIEAEFTREQVQPGNAIPYVESGDEPLLGNEDGTVTQIQNVVPDPRTKETE